MFQILKFSVDQITGMTDLKIAYDIGQGRKEDSGSFYQQSDAEKYVISSKRTYILVKLEKYIRHARIIYETGQNKHYGHLGRLQSLDRCWQWLVCICDKPLADICLTILKLQNDLEKILPYERNSSYESSRSRFIEIIVFCKQQLNPSIVTSIKKELKTTPIE